MQKITLTPKADEKYLVLEADCITPDTFAGKTLEEIAALKVYEGNTSWPLSKFFEIAGSNEVAQSPADIAIVVNGDAPKVKYIGSKMSDGAILVKGSTDMYVGAWMKGGSIIVKGSVDAFCGIQMEGGNIVIEGNAGNHMVLLIVVIGGA
jgi:formylmethanofuran dehydrogenase subunit C